MPWPCSTKSVQDFAGVRTFALRQSYESHESHELTEELPSIKDARDFRNTARWSLVHRSTTKWNEYFQGKLIFKHSNNCKLYSQGRDCLLKINGDDLAAAVRSSHGKIITWYSGPSLVLHVTWGMVRSFWVCLAAVLQTQKSYEFRSKSRHVEKHVSDEIAAVRPHDFVRSSTKPCGVFFCFKKATIRQQPQQGCWMSFGWIRLGIHTRWG